MGMNDSNWVPLLPYRDRVLTARSLIISGANGTPKNTGQDSILGISLLVMDSSILSVTMDSGVYRSLD
jgi:hypothetical protein